MSRPIAFLACLILACAYGCDRPPAAARGGGTADEATNDPAKKRGGYLVVNPGPVEWGPNPKRAPRSEPPLPNDIEVRESDELVVGGAKFSTLVESEWRLPEKNSKPLPVVIRLRITNLTNNDLLFPMFDRFWPSIKGPDHREIHGSGGRDWTDFIGPIVIGPAATYSICPTTKLTWDHQKKRVGMLYSDGTGTSLFYGPLQPGRYTLSFTYVGTHPFQIGVREKTAGIPMWQGEAVTKNVAIDVVGQ
jgi:hypothetical protein